MAAALSTTSATSDDLSRPDTPLASAIPTIEAPDCTLAVDQPDGPSLASTLKLPDSPTQYLSPTPAQHLFSLSDFPELFDGSGGVEGDNSPADITVAANGSFIETSSGPVARKLKLLYDQRAGVGPTVRSPYAITGFVSQHGKPMYRVGYRDEVSAPAASGADVEDRITHSKTPSETSSPQTKRRSRLSMHFLPPAMFTKSNATLTSRPPTANSSAPSSSKKLRKTRSIPDMFGTDVVVTTAPTFSVTGRGHSQSVTAVDIPRPRVTFDAVARERHIDFFAELMEWFTPASSASSNFSTHSFFNPGKVTTETDKPRAIITQPFGHGVTFDTPSQKLPVNRLPTPRHLREMQSFESGLTARQDDPRIDSSDNDSLILSGTSESDHEMSRPPSAFRLSSLTLSEEDLTMDPVPEDEESDLAPFAESLRLPSRYSTEVFNVLQTYRGLPLFEKLVPEFEDATVFKLSLAADQSAAPRDDPRFVLWGETLPDRDVEDFSSASRDSLTENSTSHTSFSSLSRRRSSKVSRLKSPEASISQLPVVGQKVLLAATIERWIAQLTSDLNYDELLNFFLTYRTYISGVDLCHLLISRFHWALQKPSSRQDEKVRRIVRVRTFVAIRYWLLTFFTVDFMPNRELRLLIADWLNTLIHDAVFKKHVDGIDIVRRLIKVAKECKRAHTRAPEKQKTTVPSKTAPEVEYLLGKSFAEATRKPHLEDDESDLDLDFMPDEATSEEPTTGFPSDPVSAHLTVGRAGGSAVLSPSHPTSLPLSSLNILQRTDHAPGPSTDSGRPFVQHVDAIPLPARHSVLSRAFVKTIGRLGRWKRVFNPRTSIRSAPIGPCGAGASAFDIELSASRDLLTMNGGVEQYLKMIEPPTSKTIPPAIKVVSPPAAPAAHPSITPIPTTPPPVPPNPQPSISPLPSISTVNSTPVTPASNHETSSPTLPSPITPMSHDAVNEASIIPDDPPPTLAESEIAAGALSPEPASRRRQVSQGSFSSYLDEGNGSERAQSFRSSSTDSFGAPLTSDGPLPPTFPGQHNQWQFDVVSIDDLDFSDTSSIPGGDPTHPPGLRQPLRKLPMRRDFEFVRQSEVSSMGIVSHESMRDSVSSSIHSDASASSSGPRPIQKWHMKSIRKTFDAMSDDEDTGDVEAALKRLEGQISPKIQQEKVQKIDRWLHELNNGPPTSVDTDDDSIFSREDIDIFDFDTPASRSDTQTLPDDLTIPKLEGDNGDPDQEDIQEAHTPIPTQTSHNLPQPPGPASPSSQSLLETKPAVEDVLPLEILQSRIPSMDSSTPSRTTLVNPSIETVLSSKFAGPDIPRMHRSFILGFQAEQLAEHFAMIDRELFMGIKFEELVIDEWAECEEVNILDWAQYLKDRARWRVEGRFADKTTALAAVRARFNLMVSFVVAEIVLTLPSERDVVVSKFIRIAWKSYSLSNFNTLTAIITALQNEWVSKAMRKNGWSRLSIHENRMFRDLKHFTAVADDFKFMRQAVDSIVDAKPVEGSAQASSVVSGGTDSQNGKGKASSDNRSMRPTTCIPFFGIYLSQLHRLNKLPALIDPTAPNSVIWIDPITANFDPPAHPEVFSALAPLPESMHLEPLINVHKQRRIADVIKSLVAGQHLASRVQFEIDKKLFQRCLRLRGLEPAYLQRALAMYPD